MALTLEQQMLKDAVARFVRERCRFEDWRMGVASGLAFDADNWKRMADLGWLGLGIAEHDGGIGATPAETMLVMEGFGRGLMREPFVSTCVLAMHLISRGGNALRQEILAGITDGSLLLATALGEPDARFHLHYVATQARPVPGGFLLSGHKSWVPGASTAQWLIVPARTAGAVDDRHGISLFLVPATSAAVSRTDFRGPDHQHASHVVLTDVLVSESAVIGRLHEGLPLLEHAVDHAIAARLAEACGAMEAVCTMTLDYLKMRKQFGVSIGSFQVLQHRMVDMTIACEEARSMLDFAMAHLDAPAAERRRAVSAAKARVGQCGLYVGHQAVQLHGGIGCSDELAVSHYLKRLAMIETSYGNSDFHRDQFMLASLPQCDVAGVAS